MGRAKTQLAIHRLQVTLSTLTMRHLTAIFFQGLVAILPLAVTVVILSWLGLTAERTLGVAIKWVLPDAWYIRGMGVVAGLVVIFIVGLLVNIYGVPKLIHWSEKVIAQIPLVKTIYGAVRDLLGFFSQPSGDRAVSKVVIVSFGNSGIRAVGLLTRERFDDLPPGLGGEGFVVVYFPYSYQIGGFTMIVPRQAVQPLDMRLEDAMRFIVTAGAKAGKAQSLDAPAPTGLPTPTCLRS
jgi:uncharacterized membrane protein